MATTKKTEFGDFQTPLALCRAITAFLSNCGIVPDAIVEPTCGRGSFVIAAMQEFPSARLVYGIDINPQYITELGKSLSEKSGRGIHVECKDFFQVAWTEVFAPLGGNLLVIGNPPWVTNSALGAMRSNNLPEKTNFQNHIGFAAKTGKANFDISEWMLIKLAEALNRKPACLAMLCKTSTARKVLRHVWLNRLSIGKCSLHLIDAKKHFDVSVDACLLIINTGITDFKPAAPVYRGLSFDKKVSVIGMVGKELVADIDEYVLLRDIDGIPYYTWRSGVKHDAASVMEFKKQSTCLVNGFGEECELETTYLFPLLKSSDIANGRLTPDKYVLVTQRKPSDDTLEIKNVAPRTWKYLLSYAGALDKRRSIIYEKRPRFSVFGVGDYTFSPWKVAISGLYKNCRFEVVGQGQGKPIVLDDTCYFIPCHTRAEAQFACEMLNSEVCQRFFRSLVFLDAKRPVTIDVLNRIDLKRVADRLNRGEEAREFLSAAAGFEDRQPQLVFEEKEQYRARSRKDKGMGKS